MTETKVGRITFGPERKQPNLWEGDAIPFQGPGPDQERLTSTLEPHILAFFRERGVGHEFHAADLCRYVWDRVLCAPESPGRIMRCLKVEGRLDYEVVSRSGSLYRVLCWDGRLCSARSTLQGEEVRCRYKTGHKGMHCAVISVDGNLGKYRWNRKRESEPICIERGVPYND
jgi:hypothetical protein